MSFGLCPGVNTKGHRQKEDVMRRNERGASLVELMIVIGLAGLMAGLAGESFGSAASHYKGKGMATELAAELREARYLALMRGERVTGRMAIRTEPADRPNEAIREYSYQGKNVVFDRLPSGPSLLFYPSGRTATPATIILRNSQSERWQITVSLTGRVSLS
jgi:type IV fimbrial biogenesis protein FimT